MCRPQRICRVAIALIFCLRVLHVDAAQFSLEGAVSYMDSYGALAGFGQVVFAPHFIGGSQFSVAPNILGGWVGSRNVERYESAHPNTRDSIWLLGAGVRIQYGQPYAWYRPIFFSFDPLLHDGRTQALSTDYVFAFTLGWQARHWLIGIRHISDGNFRSRSNRGENMVLVGVTL